MDDLPAFGGRPSCDTLALAMCDPGLRRRHSSECEEDSLPEVYTDSGLSTLRGSHGGYDSEPEVKGQDEEDGAQRAKKKLRSGNGESEVEVGGRARFGRCARLVCKRVRPSVPRSRRRCRTPNRRSAPTAARSWSGNRLNRQNRQTWPLPRPPKSLSLPSEFR